MFGERKGKPGYLWPVLRDPQWLLLYFLILLAGFMGGWTLDTRKCGWYGRHGMARYDHKAIHVTEWTGMEWHNDGVTALDF
jgi:hypothetical protein